tara:strand:+ start:327 stop:971 length:645 start_codon:yes stop_codon:yes gene_type:complete
VNGSNISQRRQIALKEGSAEYMAKRKELVDIAADRFKQAGYRATTLAEIGHKAGLDRATVYYYFGSKEELFRECLRYGVEENVRKCVKIHDDISRSARDRLEGVIHQLMSAYDANYPNMYVYIQEEMNRVATEKSVWARELNDQTHQFEHIVIDLIGQCRDEGSIRKDVPVLLAANAIFGMLNWTHRWYAPGGKHTAKEVSDAFAAIYFEGMAV